MTDVSSLGKLEVRGDIAALADGVRRACSCRSARAGRSSSSTARPAAARVRLRASGYRVYDVTAALAAFEIEGEDLLRRLTELDLRELPAVGSIARGTQAVIERTEGERFRLYVPQELGHFAAEVALDMAKGLAE